MSEFIASKPITLFGKKYKAGQQVPADKLDRVRRDQLEKQRKIERTAAAPGK